MSSARGAVIFVITVGFAFLFTSAVWMIHPVQAQENNVVIVNEGNVTIQSLPDMNAAGLGIVPMGTELPVTGRSADGAWWQVDSSFGIGWITNAVVTFQGVVESVPIVAQPVTTPEGPLAIADHVPATIFRNPSAESFVIGIAPIGTNLPVTGRTQDDNWWQVETNIGRGFVSIAEVSFRGDANLVPRVDGPGPAFDGPTIQLNADTTAVTEPGGNQSIASLPAGVILPASGRTADNTWWQVADVFGTGWIPVSNISLAGAAGNIRVISNSVFPGPGFTGEAFASLVIEAGSKIAFKNPSFASSAMWNAQLSEESEVIGRTTDGLWLQVANSGRIAWIHFSGVTLRGSMQDIPVIANPYGDGVVTYTGPNIAIVNTHWLNVRSGPGVEYQRIGAAPGGTTLLVTGRHPKLPWLRVEGNFGVGWVRILYIIFRGNWQAVPVINEPIGDIELPVTVVEIPRNVYSQPDLAYPAGTLVPGTYTIIGRTFEYSWALIATPLGNVWLPYNQLILRGVEASIPVVQ